MECNAAAYVEAPGSGPARACSSGRREPARFPAIPAARTPSGTSVQHSWYIHALLRSENHKALAPRPEAIMMMIQRASWHVCKSVRDVFTRPTAPFVISQKVPLLPDSQRLGVRIKISLVINDTGT
jgi:hypothetical protein